MITIRAEIDYGAPGMVTFVAELPDDTIEHRIHRMLDTAVRAVGPSSFLVMRMPPMVRED